MVECSAGVSMMARRDVTGLLERDLEQEERSGIRLEVLGEIESRRGDRCPNDARIQIVALNDKDQVIGVMSTSVSKGDPGYEAFEEGAGLQGLPARIKVVTSSR